MTDLHEIVGQHDSGLVDANGSTLHVECSCGWCGEIHVWAAHAHAENDARLSSSDTGAMTMDDCLHRDVVATDEMSGWHCSHCGETFVTLDLARRMVEDYASRVSTGDDPAYLQGVKDGRAARDAEVRARIETNLRVYQHRVDNGTATDFDQGKRAAFSVVLHMFEDHHEPTFSCGRAILDADTPS